MMLVGRFFVLVCLSLSVLVAGNTDWRDVIPSPTDLVMATEFSMVIFDMTNPSDPSQWGSFTSVAFIDGPENTEAGIGTLTASDGSVTIYVGFQGTTLSESSDFWANLDVRFYDDFLGHVGSSVHNGFHRKLFGQNLAQDIENEVMQQQQLLSPSTSRLVITGHSQGAALATLLGAYLANMWPSQNVEVLNIGSPRLGNQGFKDAMRTNLPNLSIHRMVFEEDAIPRMPGTMFAYRHVGHLLHIQGNGATKAYFQQTGGPDPEGDGDDFYPIPSSEWDMNLDLFDPLDPYYDHRDSEYAQALILANSDPGQLWPDDFQRFWIETRQTTSCCLRVFWCWRRCTQTTQIVHVY